MTILSFVTQDELDNLDEDPRMAFMGLVNHAQRSLSEQIERLNYDDRRDVDKGFELEKSFMNVIVAAGKRFEIKPFSSMDIPRHQNFNNSEYQQFRSDLDHYLTQLIIDNSVRSKKLSVEILTDSKDKIKSYVNGLRKCVEDANMEPSKRRQLLAKIDDFEKELEKRRTNFLAVALLSFEILGIPGATWASYEIMQKLVNNINQTVAESKVHEEKTRQIGSSAQAKALSAPRKAQKESGDLDDEIPF